jgi:hypothetical protein
MDLALAPENEVKQDAKEDGQEQCVEGEED